MKEQIIQLPNNFEVKEIKDGKIILVEKEKKLTYEDITNKMFPNKAFHYYIGGDSNIFEVGNTSSNCKLSNNALSKKQLEKLLAINMLMNVANYLNDGWKPDWNNGEEDKYYIQIETLTDDLIIDCTNLFNRSITYFKSRELAKQAIEILGEETIRLALCTDY